jgi:hypothetical protein
MIGMSYLLSIMLGTARKLLFPMVEAIGCIEFRIQTLNLLVITYLVKRRT